MVCLLVGFNCCITCRVCDLVGGIVGALGLGSLACYYGQRWTCLLICGGFGVGCCCVLLMSLMSLFRVVLCSLLVCVRVPMVWLFGLGYLCLCLYMFVS